MNIKQSKELSRIVMQQTGYSQDYVPRNQQLLDNSQTLALTNKKDSTVEHVATKALNI